MTLALAHGQYSHHFRPLSSSQKLARSRCSFSSSSTSCSRSTCSSRVAGTGDWEYCSVGNLFYDLRAVSPGSDCATLPLSLLLYLSLSRMSLALSCMAFNNAHIFMARSDEMGTGFWTWTNGWRDRRTEERTEGRTDGGIITFCVIFLLAFLVLCVCCLFVVVCNFCCLN